MLRRAGALIAMTCLAACGTLLGISGDDEKDPPSTPGQSNATDAEVDSTVSIIDDSGSGSTTDAGSDAAKDATVEASSVVPCNGDAGCVRYVFVTSESYVGGFGAANANGRCKTLADKSPIADVRGRQWRAWISTSTQSAVQRLQVQGTQRYRLTNNTTIATNFQALTDNSVDAFINVDENGVQRAGQMVWTGTQGNGTWVSTDCSGWTADGGANGKVGSTGVAQANGWTDFGDQSCSLQARLYCFEY